MGHCPPALSACRPSDPRYGSRVTPTSHRKPVSAKWHADCASLAPRTLTPPSTGSNWVSAVDDLHWRAPWASTPVRDLPTSSGEKLRSDRENEGLPLKSPLCSQTEGDDPFLKYDLYSGFSSFFPLLATPFPS